SPFPALLSLIPKDICVPRHASKQAATTDLIVFFCITFIMIYSPTMFKKIKTDYEKMFFINNLTFNYSTNVQ
ncbi:unnamed protein product, partial [marine sediment metagenome]